MAKPSAYPPLDSLVDLACRDGVDIRPTLLRVITDLYVQKPAHNAEEETQFVELARGLIDAIDAATLAVVADKLAAYPAAPAAILGRLGISAARPVAPATTPTVAKPAVRTDLLEAFFAASTDERRLILSNLDVEAERAARLTPASSEVIRRLENAALQRNPGEFSRMLERVLGVSRTLAERITRDSSGEPLVVAVRALGMPAAVLHRVLLFLNPAIGQSVERVYDLARLYDELAPSAAEQMLTVWRQTAGQSPPAHASVHWDDERRDARSLSSPARYHSDRARVPQPSRTKTAGN